MDDVIAFYRGASQWAKDNMPKLVWPSEDVANEASSVSTQTTVSEVDTLPSAPETNCVCPVPSSYISVCQTPNHAPRVIEQSVQPIYSINLPNDQAEILNDFVNKGSLFVRIAGLSGVSAVAMGAYGAHTFKAEEDADRKKVYDTANFYHFIHTLALLAVPLTKRPIMSGTLIFTGTTVFCGTIYYHALTNEKQLRKYTPYGGIILMLGWLAMVL